MSEVKITSDQHFRHSFLAELRGFSSVEAHDEYQIDLWNSHVNKRDIVYCLGDFFLGRFSELESIVSRLNGTKHLITGNHDKCWSAQSRSNAAFRRFMDAGFSTIQQYSVLHLPKDRKLMLNHFPYEREHDVHISKYAPFLPRTVGGYFLVHGHTHSSDTVDTGSLYPALHVGVDATPPLSVSEITDFIDGGAFNDWETLEYFWSK